MFQLGSSCLSNAQHTQCFAQCQHPVSNDILEICCRGDEPQQLRQFKDALGLDNTAAAEVHMNQARRFLRERAEAGSRTQDTEQRKALGKLVYVSYLVFGAQQAAFLMPLRRVFNIQPASIDVMRRDNAKQLFDNYIKAHGGELQVEHELHSLTAYFVHINLGCQSQPRQCIMSFCHKLVQAVSALHWHRLGEIYTSFTNHVNILQVCQAVSDTSISLTAHQAIVSP